ncbi:hypothetical protein BJ085DRAFT_7071, partial [Dimargaris cristalligena]
CANPVTRREIRQLSQGERTAFFNAFKELRRRGTFDFYPNVHLDNSPVIHGNSVFLPWHRRFVRDLEVALQSIDPSVTVPYWDWTIDSQNPAASPVFTAGYAGGNGSGEDNCVQSGPFANYEVSVPEPHCLTRDFNQGNGISTWWPAESLRLMVSDADTYTELREGLEFGQHGNVHLGIRGDMSTMYAPNDPIFFLHHAMCDKVWSVWQ